MHIFTTAGRYLHLHLVVANLYAFAVLGADVLTGNRAVRWWLQLRCLGSSGRVLSWEMLMAKPFAYVKVVVRPLRDPG
jgi:hypothetical protein